MAKRSPRLVFTEEELSAPKIEKAAKKADKALDRLEKAEEKIPKKTIKKKKRVVDPKTGKVTTRLYFEEVDKKRPPSKLFHTVRDSPGIAVSSAAHRKLREDSDGNSGAEAVDTAVGTAESGVRMMEAVHRSHQEKPYKKADKAELAADKANIRALNKEYKQQNGSTVNPYSKWQQKRAIKKEYAAAKIGKSADNTVKASEATAKAAKRTGEASKKVGEFIVRHKKAFLIIVGIAVVMLLFSVGISSCSILIQGMSSTVTASTYPLEDADMLAAEAAYCAMEAGLQEKLNNYERDYSYDEYHFELDNIEHDPYVLISAITALKGGEWKIDEVGDILSLLFEKQYIFTETVTTETRYRTETRTGYYLYTDPETGIQEVIKYDYDIQGPCQDDCVNPSTTPDKICCGA